jgi:hypothetical protein
MDSIMHHPDNIKVVYKIPPPSDEEDVVQLNEHTFALDTTSDWVDELGKVPGKIYNLRIDDWDEVTESGKWKRYTQSDPMIWKCKCCQTSYAIKMNSLATIKT